jgi:hypothetical protein
MNKQKLLLTSAYFVFALLLASCHTSRQYAAHKTARPPKFMGDIYLAPHNKNNATENAIEPAYAEKIKTAPAATPPQPGDDNATQGYHVSGGTATAYDHIVSITPLPSHNPAENSKAETSKMEEEDKKALCKKYAAMLGLDPCELTNFSLYQFIEKWYGANYKLGGCDSAGIDCSSFAQKLYNTIYGIDLDRTAKEQFGNCKRIKHPKEAKEGDLVFFHVHSRRITHVGIYLANDYFVHASSSQGVVISNLNDSYWHKYFAGCGRIPQSEFARN